MEDRLSKGFGLLLERALVWTNQFVKLDGVLFFDWDALSKQKLPLVNEVYILGRVTLGVDDLIANEILLLELEFI